MRATPAKRAFARKLRNNATPAEKALWQYLRCYRLGVKIRRQVPIRGYIADFYCACAHLVIEIDGSFHDQRRDYDARRTRHLQRAGFAVIRFTNAETLADPAKVADAIGFAILARVKAIGADLQTHVKTKREMPLPAFSA